MASHLCVISKRATNKLGIIYVYVYIYTIVKKYTVIDIEINVCPSSSVSSQYIILGPWQFAMRVAWLM